MREEEIQRSNSRALQFELQRLEAHVQAETEENKKSGSIRPDESSSESFPENSAISEGEGPSRPEEIGSEDPGSVHRESSNNSRKSDVGEPTEEEISDT